MEKQVHCKCKTHCGDRRCICRKNNEPCDEQCGCQGCQNPLNGMDAEHLTICAIHHIAQIKALSEAELDKQMELPCGDASVPLRVLLGEYLCPTCKEVYWYSFCWRMVVQTVDTWHCEDCRHCRDWREWHCDNCNRCTYGVSLPCDSCGANSELHDILGSLKD